MTAAEHLIRQQLQHSSSGWLSWRDAMALALYHPQAGYYSGSPRRIGRSGDFYTAVSVGPLYGQLIAQQAADLWLEAGAPHDFIIAEQAAHDGQLMSDILSAARQHHPDFSSAVRPVIVEPKADYREVQQATLKNHPDTQWISQLSALRAAHGLLVCNELLDALPVHRVMKKDGQWQELGLASEEHLLSWKSQPIPVDSRLGKATRSLPRQLPEGYITELHLDLEDWVRELSTSPFHGQLWMADYGLDAEDYWSVTRPTGTLRRYYRHQMDDRVLEQLGEADLTTHINLGTLLQCAEQHRLQLRHLASQGRTLTRLATNWLRQQETSGTPDPALLRQFQTLTHPGIMGNRFQIALFDLPVS
jgi:SAM-dependent MidA family methyltransferase